MFNSFSNMDSSYTPNNFSPKYPSMNREEKIQSINPNKPYEVIGRDGILKGYFWYYGNSVDLTFDITGEITLEGGEYFPVYDPRLAVALDFRATIYNSRHEPIICFGKSELDNDCSLKVDVLEDSIKVTLPINKEMSNLKMPRGTYYLDLTAEYAGYCETLFDVDACTFEVR